MKGDYFLYLAEVAAVDEKGIGGQSQPGQHVKKCDQQRGNATNTSYQTGSGKSDSFVFYYEILKSPAKVALLQKQLLRKPLLLNLTHEVKN